MDQRPFAVTVVAWIILIINIVALLSFISFYTQLTERAELTNMPVHMLYIGLVTMIINIICSICMLFRMNWSRLLYLCWGIITFIYFFVLLGSAQLGTNVVGLVIFIIFNIFLFSRSANDYFSRR